MSIYKQAIHLCFPPVCVGCEEEWALLCKTCKKEILTHPEICPLCHGVSHNYAVCFSCKQSNKTIEGIIIAFQYTGVVKRLIRLLKYNHHAYISDFLAQRLTLLIQTHPPLMEAIHNKNALISRVPSHWRRKHIIKGYNQSELLAKAVAKQLNTPCIRLWKKTRHTRSQTKLTRQQRRTNLIDAFIPYDKKDSCVTYTGKHIIIIDDITTTGTTLLSLANILKNEYPDTYIWWCVVWRHGM